MRNFGYRRSVALFCRERERRPAPYVPSLGLCSSPVLGSITAGVKRTTTSFRPLTELLSVSTTPELLFLETKWASLISYGMTARVLQDFLSLDETLNATTIQNHTLTVAQRCEEELGEDSGLSLTAISVTRASYHARGSPHGRARRRLCPGLGPEAAPL